jgi:hypothetical protein
MEYEKIVQNVEEKMLNNKNEVISVLPIRNFNGGYMKKTYKEMIEDISPDEIDELYCFLEEHTEKYVSKDP